MWRKQQFLKKRLRNGQVWIQFSKKWSVRVCINVLEKLSCIIFRRSFPKVKGSLITNYVHSISLISFNFINICVDLLVLVKYFVTLFGASSIPASVLYLL